MATHRLGAEPWPAAHRRPVRAGARHARARCAGGVLGRAERSDALAAHVARRVANAPSPQAAAEAQASVAAGALAPCCRRSCGQERRRASQGSSRNGSRISSARDRPLPSSASRGDLALDVRGLAICVCASTASTRWTTAASRSSITRPAVVVGPAVWFETRPRAPQLGLYALAQRAATSGRTRARGRYAQLKAGELAVRGLAADDAAWPGSAVAAER